MSCVFCAVVDGSAPAVRIHEDADYIAILDIRPIVRGHTLVIPKNHHVDLTDAPPETVAGMMKVGQRIARAARLSGLHADGNNVIINDAKGLVVRKDPDREATGRILRDALAALED